MGHRIVLFFCLFLLASGLTAQSDVLLQKALDHIRANEKELTLSKSDHNDMILDYQYTSKRSGGTYIYFNQAYEGIPVKNAILNATLDKRGNVIHVGNSFVKDFQKKVKTSRSSIEPAKAVVEAARHLGVENPHAPAMSKSLSEHEFEFEAASYTRSPIKVKLMFDAEDGENVRLVWQASMDMKGSPDYWEIRMDATTGEFVSKNNLTVYCNHNSENFTRAHDCGAEKAAVMTFGARQMSFMNSEFGSSYRVYALPAESPSHGPHIMVENPHSPEASPFGWHKVGADGPEYTITRGNNAFAFPDLDDNDQPDTDIPLPDGGADLVFDFEHQTNLNPVDNIDASVVNLFYMTNMMHDISYLYGFDEAAGNFQTRNYTGQGLGGDAVISQALDGFSASPPNLNNANFSTPPDGSPGRMQMYLWTRPTGSISIDSPDEIAGFITVSGEANFGNPIPGPNDMSIIGSVAIARDADFNNPTEGCGDLVTDLTGKIALIDRGTCQFGLKVLNAQRAGAVAAIICNIAGVNGGDGERVDPMAGGTFGGQVTIPSRMFRKSDCDRIRAVINADQEVIMTWQERENSGPSFIDGSFDNGIIAHEFGHGISIRLTGGPNNSGCLNNDEQMGEGWSDYFSLITSVLPGDTGGKQRGIGTYARGESTTGRGIRRFPYSTNMALNPQTFDDIKGTTAPHPLGEVWTAVTWDLYWAMVDKYGYDPDWNNFESGNAKGLSLVMEGMRIQPCRPGFIQGRDAILAADLLLHDGENQCLIWDVFARRGLGVDADGGSTLDRNDGREGFESLPTCVAELKIRKTATQLVEGGDQIHVTLDAVNHVNSRMQSVTITDEIPEGTSYVEGSANVNAIVSGNMLVFEIGEMEYEENLTINYRLSTPTDKSRTLFIEDFEDGHDFNINPVIGFDTWFVNENTAKSGLLAYGIVESERENDHFLISPMMQINGTFPALRFWHRFDTNPANHGGFIQISRDGGTIWTFLPEKFIRNGYNANMAWAAFAIPNLRGFSGTSGGWVDSYIDLRDFAGEELMFRFRFSTTGEAANPLSPSSLRGWYVDDFELIDLITYEAAACISGVAENDDLEGNCTEAVLTFVNSSGEISSTDDYNPNPFGLRLFPNPAANYINIAASSPVYEETNIQIMSFDGRLMRQAKMPLGPNESIYTMDTSGLAPGLYLVQMFSNHGRSVQKLVIH
jgi:extracellular elastinolytic metalloproteinase